MSNQFIYPTMAVAAPQTGTRVEKKKDTSAEEKLEKRWKVIIHNDDSTPMDFVVIVLVQIFNRPLIFAEAIMIEAHNNGMAVVVALPKKEAEAKVRKAQFLARLEGYPLKLTIEKDD